MTGRPAGGKLRLILPAVLTAAAGAFLLGFLFVNRAHLAAFYSVSPGAFLQIGLLTILVLLLLSLANKVHFGGMGMGGSWYDWFHLVTVGAFTNYLPANAGIAVKAFYLKRVHGTPYGTFIVGQAVLFLVFIAAGGACGLASLAAAPPQQVPAILVAGFLGMLSAGALPLLPKEAVRRLGGRRWGERLAAGRPDLHRMVPTAILQGAVILAVAASLKISFDMGPADVPLSACITLAAAAPLSRLAAITPGALGVRELFLGGLAYLMGFTVRDAIIASTFSRLVEFTVVCSFGALFTYRLSAKITSTFNTDPFPGTERYWENRYAGGGGSGQGSCGAAARHKASFLNAFAASHGIRSVIEFGCGDGRQLALASYERYLGFDVSRTAIARCRQSFAGDGTKEFRTLGEYAGERAELAISLDVIYHLVEDETFARHMELLFGAASRYVVIYGTDTERQILFGRRHVRHRRFSDWVGRQATQWRLRERRRGWHRLGRLYRGPHRADFFVYERLRAPEER